MKFNIVVIVTLFFWNSLIGRCDGIGQIVTLQT